MMKVTPLLDLYPKELEPFKSTPLFSLFTKIQVLHADSVDYSRSPLSLPLDAAQTIAVGHALPFDQVIRLMHEGGLRHVVQSSRENFVFDLLVSALMLNKPAAFQANPQPYFTRQVEGLIDLARTSQAIEFPVTGSEDKPGILKKARAFLSENPSTAAIVQPAAIIIDEMIMNAVYDAPSEVRPLDHGAGEDRSKPSKLAPHETARVFLSYDSKRLLIGCEDPFGSVNDVKLLKRLHELYSDPDNIAPILSGPGAGLGCKVMIDYSCGFYMTVARGKKTVVCASMPLNVSIRKFETLPKHMHFCCF
jgi:hypothetical protein